MKFNCRQIKLKSNLPSELIIYYYRGKKPNTDTLAINGLNML